MILAPPFQSEITWCRKIPHVGQIQVSYPKLISKQESLLTFWTPNMEQIKCNAIFLQFFFLWVTGDTMARGHARSSCEGPSDAISLPVCFSLHHPVKNEQEQDQACLKPVVILNHLLWSSSSTVLLNTPSCCTWSSSFLWACQGCHRPSWFSTVFRGILSRRPFEVNEMCV